MKPVFGVSYYPEWTEPSEWRRDLQTMRDHGLTCIRMLEFAWTRLEPEEGRFTLDWLDDFLNLAAEVGIDCILGTPTATPPAWMIRQFPEMQIELRDGEVRAFGGRRDSSPSSTIYRHFCEQIVRVLAERYGRHPAVCGWQIDNELIGPEGLPPECHNRDSTWRFRDWLKKKYGNDLTALNRAWGTHFWSHEFAAWGEINTPRIPRANLGLCMDYYRFFSDMHREFMNVQVDVLRAIIDPRQFITHNCTGILDRSINHRSFAKDLDVIGWDAYRGAAYSNSPSKEGASAFGHDLYRCMKQKPFWILETNADQSMTAAYTAEMIAHGAAGVMFFHYRQHRAGAEQTLRCLADLHGDPVPERVGFTQSIAARPELREELPDTCPPRAAAIVFDYDCVHEQQRRFSYPKPMPYLDALMRMYLPAWRGGLGLDVIDPADDLGAYSLILLPHHQVCTEAFAAKLTAYVAEGGNLFLSARTCHKDEHGSYHPHLYGPLRDLIGAIAHEETDLKTPTACTWDGQRHQEIMLADALTHTGDSEILSAFEGGVLDGKPALLHHRHGKGRCWFAAASHEGLNRQVLHTICREMDLPFIDHPHTQVAVLPHLSRKATWIFNHSTEPVDLLGHHIPAGDFVLGQGS